jgi:hypothetical protein
MRFRVAWLMACIGGIALYCAAAAQSSVAQSASSQLPSSQSPDDRLISPARPVPVGNAPGMQVKLVKDTPEEKIYAVVFYKGDEALSGLTDFALKYGVGDAHFTGIGAVTQRDAWRGWIRRTGSTTASPCRSRWRCCRSSATWRPSMAGRWCICTPCWGIRMERPAAVTSLS